MKDLKKKDICDMSYKDIAYLIIEKDKTGKNTLELFTEIVNLLELPQNTIDTQIADFYTSLTTDKRFLMIDGLWDLRNRHTSDKILSSVEDDDEEENLDEEEVDIDDENDSYEEETDIDEDTSYDDDDDGLSDLVILDEEEMDIENN